MRNGDRISLGWVDRDEIAVRQNNVCYVCEMRKIKHTFHLDHKIALCNGGGNEQENLGLICSECHRQKTKIDRRIKYTIEKDRKEREEKNTFVYKKDTCYAEEVKIKKPVKKTIKSLSEIRTGKVAISIRFDYEIVKFFRDSGHGWQSKMNYILSEYVRENKK